LVFSFLIVPASCATLFFKKINSRLFFGWGVGVIASMMGVYFSYAKDFPTGPSIVTALGSLMILCLLAKRFLRSQAAH
ncbi:MAG: metal ABC transporter permease, partial [Deltaproteobacteria bacterium]|nr:metal ABC transporter permease [Deltaproteobacteria bacterium]